MFYTEKFGTRRKVKFSLEARFVATYTSIIPFFILKCILHLVLTLVLSKMDAMF